MNHPVPVWRDNTPDTLLDISVKYCISNHISFCGKDPLISQYRLYEGVTLPVEICEKMFEVYHKSGSRISNDFITVFNDARRTRLRRVCLKNSSVDDHGIATLLKHNLIELDISDCKELTSDTLETINAHGQNLLSLIVGDTIKIFPGSFEYDNNRDLTDFGPKRSEYHRRGYILNCPNLRKFVVTDLKVSAYQDYYPLLLKNMTNLVYLDLSRCKNLESLCNFLPVTMKYLRTLILYNVPNIKDSLMALSQMKTLRHLDISQSMEDDESGFYQKPNKMLSLLVNSLPDLDYLDISGTNLAGTGVVEREDTSTVLCDIPGLNSRLNRPLGFLGLYNTSHGACCRHHIPALKISGDANEKQLLVAAEVYCDRVEILLSVLNDIFRIFRSETFCNHIAALEVVVRAMERHRHHKNIQISGSACLFYIVKGELKASLNVRVKKRIIQTLLTAMMEHKRDPTLIKNGCLTLCHFNLPEDILFDYERLVTLLLMVVSERDQDEFVQRLCIYLINSLACQVDGELKKLVGDLGVMNTMLTIIKSKLIEKVCDEVMEFSWSTMWNVTDETSINCERFLDGQGMRFFLKCLDAFPDKDELLRNMMGLVGNVAEVPHLRSRLMTPELTQVFISLLNSSSDGIEVSYNAAGVLAHMASDGEEAWTVKKPTRETALKKMVEAILTWDLTQSRNINYRSFEPILRLVRVSHTPEAQLWAVWALANLTTVYGPKYCPLVEQEGGLPLLNDLFRIDRPYPEIHSLATKVIDNCSVMKGSIDPEQPCILMDL